MGGRAEDAVILTFPKRWRGLRALSLTPVLPNSSSSARRSPSLRVPWGPLRPLGSPSPRVLPRPLQVPHKALLEQPPARPLPDPSSGPRTLGPTLSFGASSSTRPR